jgi:capsule polysaccharide modification protein KpsS
MGFHSEFKVAAIVNHINFLNGDLYYYPQKETLNFSGKRKFTTLGNHLFKKHQPTKTIV